MASFLTALAQMGNQYGTAKVQAGEELAKRQQQAQEMQMRAAQLGLEQSRQQMAEQQWKEYMSEAPERAAAAKAQAMRDKYLTLGKGQHLFSIEQGKLVPMEEAQAQTGGAALKAFRNSLPRSLQQQADNLMMANLGVYEDPEQANIESLKAMRELYKEYRQQQEKMALKVRPEVAMQIGDRPNPDEYKLGENDPAYQAALKKYGRDIELTNLRIATALDQARSGARETSWITPEGMIVPGSYAEAQQKSWTPYVGGKASMDAYGRLADIQVSFDKLRSAIQALQPGDAFSPVATAQLEAAMGNFDLGRIGNYIPGSDLFKSAIENVASQTTNPRQQDFLVWLASAGESALFLSRIGSQGMRGAMDVRNAVRAMMPRIALGDKAFAMKYMDSLDTEYQNLGRYIPRTNINPPSLGNIITPPPTPGAEGSFSPATDYPNAPQSPIPQVTPPAQRPDPSNPLGLKLD